MYFRMFILCVCAVLLSTTTDVVQSRYVFRLNIHGWLQPHKVIATWEEAQQQCHSEGGLFSEKLKLSIVKPFHKKDSKNKLNNYRHITLIPIFAEILEKAMDELLCYFLGAVLASPIRANLLDEMKSIMEVNHHNTPYFIGTKMRQHPGPYVSEEGIPIDDMPVADMLERVDSDEGDCLSMDGYSINVVPCATRLPYICYHNTTDCGTGYKFVSSTGRCYKKHTDKTTWDAAEATCIAEGGHLVVINDSHEAQIIKDMGIPSYPFVFVGVRFDVNGDDYISIHGDRLEQIYNVKRTSWGRWGCVTITNEAARLDNYGCYENREYICEKDPDNVRLSS